MADMAGGNAFLSERFAMTPFPAVSDDGPNERAPYPGLAPERAEILAARHARIRRSARYRIGRQALLAREFIQQRLPKLSWIIPFGRSLSPQRRRPR
jgi:hypothetical protein